MPFISTNTDLFRKRGPSDFLLVIVEKVMLVSCDDIVTLSASILGDQTYHTVQWEQIGGTPVIWLEEQDQVMVTWQQPTIRDDKTFRLTVDKGTKFEIIKDLIVTAIPLEYAGTVASTSGTYATTKWTQDQQVSQIYIAPAFTATSDAVANDSKAISFSPATTTSDTVLTTELQSYSVLTQSWTTLITKQGSFQFFPIQPNISHRVKLTMINYYKMVTVTYSDVFSFSDAGIVSPAVSMNEYSSASFSQQVSTPKSSILEIMTRTRVEINQTDDDISATKLNNPSTATSTILERFTRSIVSLPYEQDLASGVFISSTGITVGTVLERKTLGLTTLG